MKKYRKKILVFCLITLTLIPLFVLTSSAGYYYGPQDLNGLQNCYVSIYWGDSTAATSAACPASSVVSTTAYTTGVDLADIICNTSGLSNNTKCSIRFTWQSNYKADFNAVCIKGIPADTKVTVYATGIGSMTGTSYSQDFVYVSQQDGWYKYDSFSYSATMTPMFSQIYTLQVTIDCGSAFLKTLIDDDIIFSTSLLPYNLSQSSELQYNQGYSDAAKVYSANLKREKQASYDAGERKGYSDGYSQAEIDLEELIYDDAYDDGYFEGRSDGLAIAEKGDLRNLILAIPESHLTALEGFMSWNLLGYNLYELLGGIVVLVFIVVLLKLGIKFAL